VERATSARCATASRENAAEAVLAEHLGGGGKDERRGCDEPWGRSFVHGVTSSVRSGLTLLAQLRYGTVPYATLLSDILLRRRASSELP
jgi:hypothetical protein